MIKNAVIGIVVPLLLVGVGVGTYMKTRSPAFHLLGTGFAVADGLPAQGDLDLVVRPYDI